MTAEDSPEQAEVSPEQKDQKRSPDEESLKAPSSSAHPSMDHRRERIRVETPRHRIEGYMTLARDGYRSRMSDVLNASERDFLTLTEVTVQPLEGGPLELHPYLTLARAHIVFAVASAEPGAESEALR